jgi:hypothetical protein
MSDDLGAKPGDGNDTTSDVHPSDTSLTETPSTRRTALGMTATATAAILADRAIFAPGSARAEPEIVESVNGKHGKVVDIAEVNTEGKLLESELPTSVANGSPTLGSILVGNGTAWVLATASEAGQTPVARSGEAPSWAKTGLFPLEAWKALISGEDWKPALEAAIKYAAERGGGVILLPEGEVKLSAFPEMPASGQSLGAVHIKGPGKHSCRVRITADAGAGHFAIKWAGTTETENTYCYCRLEGFMLEGSTEAAAPYAMDGIMGARKNQFSDVAVLGFHSGWYPYGDHIFWEDCEAYHNTYGVYYGIGPTNLGNHEMRSCNWTNNKVASFAVSQHKNTNGIINRPAPAVMFGGHLGFSEYCVLIEEAPSKEQNLVWQMSCYGTSWEKPSAAFMDEIPEAEGKRWGCVGGFQGMTISGGSLTTDSASLTVGFRANAFSQVTINSPINVAKTTGKSPALFSATLAEGIILGPAIPQYIAVDELYAEGWRLFDANCVNCKVLTGSAEYQVVNVNSVGTPTPGRFVTYVPGSTSALSFPGGERAILMVQNAKERSGAAQPLLGLLQRLDSSEAKYETALVMTRGNTGGKGIPVEKVSSTEEIAEKAAVYLASSGQVGLNKELGPQVGCATELSKSGTTTVNIQFDLATIVTASGLSSSEVPFAAPFIVTGKGYYYAGNQEVTTSSSLGNGTLRLAPVFIPISCTIEALFAEFVEKGEAVSLFATCIYADSGSFYPDELLITGPTISTGTGNAGSVATGGTAGVYGGTVSQAVARGIYWIGGVLQGTVTTQPSIRTGVWLPTNVAMGTSIPSAGQKALGFTQAGVTGALPSTFSSTLTPSGSFPRVGFRIT